MAALFEKTVKISSKGQITLPRQVRSALGTQYVRIVLSEGHVHIEPVREVAGVLAAYARSGVAHTKARNKAWKEAMREKHGRR